MYNEEAHADLIIDRCCRIAWPRSRLLIQVRVPVLPVLSIYHVSV